MMGRIAAFWTHEFMAEFLACRVQTRIDSSHTIDFNGLRGKNKFEIRSLVDRALSQRPALALFCVGGNPEDVEAGQIALDRRIHWQSVAYGLVYSPSAGDMARSCTSNKREVTACIEIGDEMFAESYVRPPYVIQLGHAWRLNEPAMQEFIGILKGPATAIAA